MDAGVSLLGQEFFSDEFGLVETSEMGYDQLFLIW